MTDRGARRKVACGHLVLVSLLATPLACSDPCDRAQVGTICTIAGTGENAFDPDSDTQDVPALDATFSLPMDTLVAPDGLIYVLDWNNHRLRSLHDGVVSWVAGNAQPGGGLDDPAAGAFNHPTNVIFDATGHDLIMAAWRDSRIVLVDPDTGSVSALYGNGERAYFGDGGDAATASFDLPSSLVLDGEGNLVILDQENQVLRTVDESGTIRRLAGRCVIDPDFSRTASCFDGKEPVQCPDGPLGPSGKLVCGGDLSLCNRPCSPGYTGDDVAALDMLMYQPYGQAAAPAGRLVFDPEGNLIFADSGNNTIRMIHPDGSVERIAGRAPEPGEFPQGGYAGDGGDARNAVLNMPVDVALADDGTLYVTDVMNSCVRAIDPDGAISTVAGVCGQKGFSGDGGPADQALLNRPFGIEWSDGRLIIADTANNVIRAVRL